jgi:hypothetical protein
LWARQLVTAIDGYRYLLDAKVASLRQVFAHESKLPFAIAVYLEQFALVYLRDTSLLPSEIHQLKSQFAGVTQRIFDLVISVCTYTSTSDKQDIISRLGITTKGFNNLVVASLFEPESAGFDSQSSTSLETLFVRLGELLSCLRKSLDPGQYRTFMACVSKRLLNYELGSSQSTFRDLQFIQGCKTLKQIGLLSEALEREGSSEHELLKQIFTLLKEYALSQNPVTIRFTGEALQLCLSDEDIKESFFEIVKVSYVL